MAYHKSRHLPLTLFSIALSLECVLFPSFLAKVQAQSDSGNRSQNGKPTVSVTFEPPNEGKPDNTAGGASRGNGCPLEVRTVGGCVIPLVPSSKNGLTVAERPTFFIYIPETSAKEIFFSLVGENSLNRYQTKIPINGKSGIISYKIPDNAPALEVGKNYKWTFIIVGPEGIRPDSPGIKGEIQRVKPNATLTSQLQNKSLVERASLYGKNGIWYDTIASLAEAIKLQPNDSKLTVAWQNLLKSVGLEEIATKRMLN